MQDLSITARVKIIRLRTWTLTITITALLILYIFVTLAFNSKIEWIDFAITAGIQISTHFAYFADGERYGETDPLYVSAKTSYNDNAARIITDSTVERLREYCEEEYLQRRNDYITDVCGAIGISVAELGEISKKPEAELRAITKWESEGKTVYFDRAKRKMLLDLIFGKSPVEKNQPSMILSAVDRDYVAAIKDGSTFYRKATHASRLFKSIVVGGILAYIGYNIRDGLNFAAVVKSCVFIGSMITSAVSSYIAGEKASREYRKQFYLELSLFIDAFFSWTGKKPEKATEMNAE